LNDTLPDPLVPAEIDLRGFETMPLAVQLVRDSRFVSEVKPEAFRAGFLLWCASWHQVPAGSIPDNDIELAKLAGYGFAVGSWKRLRREALMNFTLCSDGRYYHREVSARALVAWQSRLEHFYERAKERLRKANKARADEKPPRQALPTLTFEQWNERRLSAGIPMEKAESFAGIQVPEVRNSGGSVGGIPAENPLKGEGEGTEREQKALKEKETTAASRLVVRSADAPPDDPQRTLPETGPNPKPYAVPDCPYEAIVDAYHHALAMLPRVTVLNDARREHMRARWREVCADARFDATAGLEWFRWYFEHAASSSFLTGRGSSRGRERPFTANFDWLLLPTNFAKVIDGNYLDSRAIA
jgi:hypothetical protein